MTVQAEISLYPLAESDLLPVIEDFLGALTEQGLNPQTGAMSTIVAGDSATVFSTIAEAFEQVAADHRCVLIVKYSNACPPAKEEITGQD
jgi:uncharacterized protein YqgV (UPF0045/DUF77 family)